VQAQKIKVAAVEAAGASGGARQQNPPPRRVWDAVMDILERLEGEGIGGVVVRFVRAAAYSCDPGVRRRLGGGV